MTYTLYDATVVMAKGALTSLKRILTEAEKHPNSATFFTGLPRWGHETTHFPSPIYCFPVWFIGCETFRSRVCWTWRRSGYLRQDACSHRPGPKAPRWDKQRQGQQIRWNFNFFRPSEQSDLSSSQCCGWLVEYAICLFPCLDGLRYLAKRGGTIGKEGLEPGLCQRLRMSCQAVKY